jgi:xanthine/uracil/vitamin C permease (AzgA family)
VLQVVVGRTREIHWLMWIVFVAFLVFFAQEAIKPLLS